MGSGSVVDLGASPFLLTAAHVVTGAIARRETTFDTEFTIGRDRLLDPEKDLISLSPSADIATLRLSNAQISALQAEGVIVIRPPRWPPPELAIDDVTAMVGYPGPPWRRHTSLVDVEHAALMFAMPVTGISARHFKCRIDLSEGEMRTNISEPPDERVVGGLSGAPTFLLRTEQCALIAPQLCGVVTEGRPMGQHLILAAATLASLQADGTIL